MKKNLLALSLSLLATGSVFAEYHDQASNAQTNNNCCSPCCAPNPRNPANCECYVPAWYDMECDWGVFLSVDFLYWYGRECNLPYAVKVVNQNGLVDTSGNVVTTVAHPSSYAVMDTSWDPGVRVGLGWNVCDGWDLYFKWTGYWNRRSDSESVTEFDTLTPAVGSAALQSLWAYPTHQNNIAPLFSKVSAKWRLDFNRFDLEMGRRYWLSRCFTFRPFVGLGGIWTETRFNVTERARTMILNTTTNTSYTISGSEKFRNRNWGVGLIGGFEPTFQFTDCFALYGSAGMALLWGRTRQKVNSSYVQTFDLGSSSGPADASMDYPYTSQASSYCMLPILDLGIGLRWETFWCDRQYHFAVDLGWEHHTLFQHNRRVIVDSPFSSQPVDTGNPLGYAPVGYTFYENNVHLGGLVVRVRFDF